MIRRVDRDLLAFNYLVAGMTMFGLIAFSSVYEKLFETSDIMSDAFELCVGHFHFMLDIFLFNIKTLGSVIKNSHIFANIRDILTYPDFWPPWDT